MKDYNMTGLWRKSRWLSVHMFLPQSAAQQRGRWRRATTVLLTASGGGVHAMVVPPREAAHFFSFARLQTFAPINGGLFGAQS
jgi:hypothetical protein